MHHLPLQPTMAEANIPDGLTRNENHLVVMIGENWFSYVSKGDAIQFHLFSKDPKTLSKACEIFIKWVFDSHKWCRMLLVTINKRSLINLALKHQFKMVDKNGNAVFLARTR